jgi:hypothetical protein
MGREEEWLLLCGHQNLATMKRKEREKTGKEMKQNLEF